MTRLIDIGVAGYKIATAVKGVVAQRLVRRVCPECDATGCAACDGAGYRGRLAVAEILVASPEFERRVAAGAPTEALTEAARLSGCVTLWESGMALVARRETTIEELRRVAAAPARVVNEPEPRSPSARVQIGWLCGAATPRCRDIHAELLDAASTTAGRVQVVSLAPDSPGTATVDAVVTADDGIPDGPGAALVVLVARDAATASHVASLGRNADLVVSDATHGRLLLATILALLRWRLRE